MQFQRLFVSSVFPSCSFSVNRSIQTSVMVNIMKKDTETVPPEYLQPAAGRYKWYEPPAYLSVHRNVLEQGPDFTFKDGRKAPFSTMQQLRDRQEEIAVAQQIVKCLKELKEVEDLHADQMEIAQQHNREYMKNRPKQKGSESIANYVDL